MINIPYALYSTNMTNQLYFVYVTYEKEIRHFRNEESGPSKVSKRLLGLLPGTTKIIVTDLFPVTFPETSAGRSSVPVAFSLLKWPIEGHQASPWCNQLRKKNENATT